MLLAFKKKIIVTSLIGFLLFTPNLNAQSGLDLEMVFPRLFETIIGGESTSGLLTTVVDPMTMEDHADHFKESSRIASTQISTALNQFIASNVSSFPLSSTAAGRTWDLSTGEPVSILESLGPIFAETGKTMGKGRVNMGLNYTFLDLTKLRGIKTQDMAFVFTHQDSDDLPLGSTPNESDLMTIKLGLDVNAHINAFFATFGVTERFDVGLAIPIISIDMDGTAEATINSFTFASRGEANHRFGPSDSTNQLETEVPYGDFSDFQTGLGDVTLRLKYSFAQEKGVNFAVLLDTRLPTGSKENFRGTGKTNIRLVGILSKQIEDFTPHLNVGYDYRGAEFDSDEIEFAFGFDQKIVSGVTFALDILGEMDLDSPDVVDLPKGTFEVIEKVGINEIVRTIDRSNVPDRDNDNIFSLAAGFRIAPSKNLIFLANALVPLNEGGLRSNIIPTAGLAFSF